MSVSASKRQEQNETAQLAAHFNEFYLQITLPSNSQIGNYRILKEIGEGAFGKVYLAEHVLLQCQVVLKSGLLEDPNIVREIYYHKELRHRNIVKLYEVIKTETHLWMVLEYCEGNELYYHIYEKRRLDIPSCKNYFYQIVEAIRYVHSLNLAHRDLKLENILMADAEKTVIKLTDFGFVREFNPYRRSLLSTVCGTTSYMAPEVLNNEKYSGFAIDVWSMGIILYAMAYGQLPFDEDDDMKTRLKIISQEPKYHEFVPHDLNVLLQQMLSKNPSKRPSVSEILNSAFLIDLTNSRSQRRSSSMTDTDSIVSINQYYNIHTMPFQSRMEKDLLKKLRKANIDVEALITSKMNGHANSLTAYYDLALKSELEKQKRRNVRKKRYYEAKKQLRRSKKRVKSVLSLSDQANEDHPLEKILTSLSITSNKNENSPSMSNMTRRSSDNITQYAQIQRRLSFPKAAVSNNNVVDQNGSLIGKANGDIVQTPLERSVSFYMDDQRGSDAPYELGLVPSKSKQILDRLRFWKKTKRKDGDWNVADASSSISQPSTPLNKSDNGVLEINIAGRDRLKAEADSTQKVNPRAGEASDSQDGLNKGNMSIDKSTIAANPVELVSGANEFENSTKRQRPASVISQLSQYSQASHLYAMSESELDMMDGTDIEDDYYDDEGTYDSSINVSQHDLHHRATSYSSSRTRRRPQNQRIPSDNLIISSSTSATRRKNRLSQVSSNSSDDSSAILRLSERTEYGNPDATQISRPISPRSDFGRGPFGKSRLRRTLSSSKNATLHGLIMAPSPVVPHNKDSRMSRSASPPIAGKPIHKFNGSSSNSAHRFRVNSMNSDASLSNVISGRTTSLLPKAFLKLPSPETHTWRRDSPISTPSINVFERKFISINEEEEDEEDPNQV